MSESVPHAAPRTGYRLTFGRMLRSEAIKIATVRSTWWSIGVVVIISLGISLLFASAIASAADAAGSAGISAQVTSVVAITVPTQFTLLLAAALGAITVTGEYSTGMIRSTFTAQPRRGVVLAAKSVVVAALLAATSIVVFALSVAATAPILSAAEIDWGTPSASLLPLLAGVLAMAVVAVLGLSFGFILRSGPGAVAAVVGLLFILPIVAGIFPSNDPGWRWVHEVAKYLPSPAAQTLMTPSPGSEAVGALLALLGWLVAGVLGAWLVLRTRDA